MESMECTLKETVKETAVEIPPSFEFTSYQQWQIAFIYAFAVTFNPHQEIAPSFYRLPEFSPKELEEELKKESSTLIHQIICASVGNILNCKAAIDTFKIALQQLVTDKIKTFDIDIESNPLSKVAFPSLPTDVKLHLLHSMIEWQLQDSLAVKSILEHYNSTTPRNQYNPVKSYPIGTDSKKRNYWQFGECSWIWREKPHVKPTCEWELVCKSKQELEQLVNTLSTTNRAEKALSKVITTEIYELAEKEEKKLLRKERAELRKLIPVEISITPTQLRSRGRSERVRYNYDDEDIYGIEEDRNDDDEFIEDEEEGEQQSNRRSSRRTTSSNYIERPPPTRWSSRLNGQQQTIEDDVEDIVSDMDTTPSESLMDISRSQSVVSVMDLDSTPQSAMEF
ncbi:unnamed protein product [Mucor hiemalis]